MQIEQIVKTQKKYFKTGATKDVAFRLLALKKLKKAILKNISGINDALLVDLNKSTFESYMTEIGLVLHELSYAIRHLRSWARTRHVPSFLIQFHASSFVTPEPFGVALIISPWNFPFLLTIEPLIGAIAAGNCCVLKPSGNSPATSAIIAELILGIFAPDYITVIQGGRNENTDLLDQNFDYLFFTGSVKSGKLIMEKASVNLTPITLELGGKNPCIVDKTANLDLAAKRIIFGKYLNAGQTCIAPDYLLVHSSVKEELMRHLKQYIFKFYGPDPISNTEYPKIINRDQFDRITRLYTGEQIYYGGKSDPESLKIEPVILDRITTDSPVMQEEIFGPVLPVLSFETLEEAENLIEARSKPLAVYLFTKDKKAEQNILKHLLFGGGCINDAVVHIASLKMGYGGVGASGYGSYHGKFSFDTFSHYKGILKKFTWIDTPIRYHPYSRFKEKLLRILLK